MDGRRGRRAMAGALLGLGLACAAARPPGARAAAGPPRSRTVACTEALHGVAVADPYRWLEDDRDPEVAAWAAAQDAWARRTLTALPRREAWRQALRRLGGAPHWEAPWRRGAATFSQRNAGAQPQDVVWVEEDGRPARPLLDVATLPGEAVSLAGLAASPDGRLLAYALRDDGTDWQRWRIRDVARGTDLPDEVRNSKFSGAAWRADGRAFYYTQYLRDPDGAAGAGPRIMVHRLGRPEADDAVAFAAAAPGTTLTAEVSADGRWLVVAAAPGDDKRNVLWAQDLAAQTPPWPVTGPLVGRNRFIGSHGAALWVLSTDAAPRGAIERLDVGPGGAVRRRVVVPEAAATLNQVSWVGDALVALYLVDGHAELRLYGADGTPRGVPPLPGVGSVRGLDGTPDSPVTHLMFDSPVTPPTIFRLDTRTAALTAVFAPPLAAEVADLVSHQEFVEADDGARLAVTVSHRRDLRRDGRAMLRLYGYGGFNAPVRPHFSEVDVAWMQAGGVFAAAITRGGGEYGDAWYRAGTQTHKQRVFDDFVAVARHLTAAGYTSPARLAIEGNSNGGLLVAACMVQQPRLFGAVVAEAGVLDMLRFERFTCGADWTPDYGSVANPAQFAALRAYSPLHNLRPEATYPATLVVTGDHDDRVVPAHSFKFAAALQAVQAGHPGAPPALLSLQRHSGHGAGRPWAQRLEAAADRLAFCEAALTRPAELSAAAGSPGPP